MTAAGILGLGVYLPPEVRTNDWWPAELVAGWLEERKRAAPLPPPEHVTDGARRIMAAMTAQAIDPFQGVVERHIMSPDMTVAEMESRAGHDALERAGIGGDQIDLLLTNTVTPDHQLSNPAAVLHARMGLPTACFALQIEAAAYSFLAQLSLAAAMIESGRARYALLVQSTCASRLVTSNDVVSPYFGDGATAVVVGPVATRGMLGAVHFADGSRPNTIVAGVPGHTWYSEGRSVIHVGDPVGLRSVLLQTVDLCASSVKAVLARCGVTPEKVDFFCIHQGTPWLRSLAQESAGLRSARTVDTFAKTGYLFSAIIPLGLRMASDQGLLARGDLVMLFGGGTGMTYGATLLEWGAR